MRRNRMKNWKTVLAGLFIFCLLICAPLAVFAEEDGAQQEEETEEPVPESYDYPIGSQDRGGVSHRPGYRQRNIFI